MLVPANEQAPLAHHTSICASLPPSPPSNRSEAEAAVVAAAATAPDPRRRLITPLLSYAGHTTNHQHRPATPSFPLSLDHRLITLVQYNILRAMLCNMSILSLLHNVPASCPQAVQIHSFVATSSDAIPVDLQPTPLQRSTPHSFWIGAIPFPRMRDNLIAWSGRFDSHDFCLDLGQALYEGFDDVERRGCLVWGDPWIARGWEVSEGFVRKWGFLLRGCLDVMASTNRWRATRGEDPLAFGI